MPSRIFVFDAYGTLFDVHAVIARHSSAAGPDGPRLSEIWRTKQLEYSWTLTLSGHYADFWTLTQRALDFALARCPSVDKALRPKLLDAYFKLDAFPDAREMPGMLKAAVDAAAIGGNLDAVLSVDPLRIYKPRPEVYALVTETFQIAPASA